MLKRMLNRPEQISYRRLSEVCTRRSALVYAKVRLADVLPIEGSGLSQEFYDFSLKAHYDFVITDSIQLPLFAVEFDGPQHSLADQVERDSKKDELSRRFELPLLRINANDLFRTEWRLDRLTEWTERWFDRIDGKSGNVPAGSELSARILLTRGRDVMVNPSCPQCQSDMIIKPSKYGPFFSCVRYPACKGACDLPTPSDPSSAPARVEPVTGSGFSPREVLIAGIAVGFLALLLVIIAISWSRPAGPGGIDRPSVVTHPDANISPSDAPAIRHQPREIEPPSVVARPDPTRVTSDAATVRQMNLLGLLIRRRVWDTSKRDTQVEVVLGYRRRYEELNKKEASKLITAWDDRAK